MAKLLCYQYLLVGTVLTWSFSVSGNVLLCKIGCEGQYNVCIHSLTPGDGLRGFIRCTSKKFKCIENCPRTSRVKNYANFVRNYKLYKLTTMAQFYITKNLCPHYCKAVYKRIDPVCTKKCSAKLLYERN